MFKAHKVCKYRYISYKLFFVYVRGTDTVELKEHLANVRGTEGVKSKVHKHFFAN